MEKSFCLGLALGCCAGLLLAVNSYAVRKFVCEKQQTVKDGIEKMAEQRKNQQDKTEE
ncbi:MAG: hypothetical protein MRZ91_01465 [Christensenellaceae bacterium]|nr:hypothetical protein [Christensenellaceae bacterium]MDD6927058.1 hypothetical protein [bacterium]MDY2851563.1 hypothetical protein [Christensenellaceae bacterium]